MKSASWALVTLATLLLTGFVLSHTHRIHVFRSGHSHPRRVEVHGTAQADPLLSDAAFRWRQGLPNHWRACLLQR